MAPTRAQTYPTPPSAGRSSAMKLQRIKDTEPEVALRLALHHRGLRFFLHRRLLPGCVAVESGRVVYDGPGEQPARHVKAATA